jgi:hypothetical protein
MTMKLCAALVCAAAIALSPFAVMPADAQTQHKRAVAKKSAKRYGPVPISMDPPRARITVQRRTFLDAGTHVIPGDRKFTDYALPPTFTPFGPIENTAFYHRSPLPGPFTLPGRDNPYPWHYCVGC